MAGKHSGEHLPASLVWSYRALLLNRIIRTPCGCTLAQSKRFRNRIRSGTFPSCPPSLTSAEAAAVPAAPCPARLRPTRDTRRPAGHFLLTSGVRGHLARARAWSRLLCAVLGAETVSVVRGGSAGRSHPVVLAEGQWAPRAQTQSPGGGLCPRCEQEARSTPSSN